MYFETNSSWQKVLIIPLWSSDHKSLVDWDPGFVFIVSCHLFTTKKFAVIDLLTVYLLYRVL